MDFERLVCRSGQQAETCIPAVVCALRLMDAHACQPPTHARLGFCKSLTYAEMQAVARDVLGPRIPGTRGPGRSRATMETGRIAQKETALQ